MLIRKLFIVIAVLLSTLSSAHASLDSYSFFHVTIETPWAIFIFLCFLVLAPFVVMAILYWHFAFRRHNSKTEVSSDTTVE